MIELNQSRQELVYIFPPKICIKLGLRIEIFSVYKRETEIKIIFPKSRNNKVVYSLTLLTVGCLFLNKYTKFVFVRRDFMNQEKIGKFIAECRKKQA